MAWISCRSEAIRLSEYEIKRMDELLSQAIKVAHDAQFLYTSQ